MTSGVQNAWSTTAADNDDADTAVNMRENQAPSTYNDAVRAIMAKLKATFLDWQGGLVTGGTSTAYTLTTNETLALANGVKVTCRMSATNGAAPTLNVDSTGAVAIQTAQGTAVPIGALIAGGIYTFTYYSSSAAWIVHGLVGAGTRYIGEVFDFGGATAPPLCLLCYGQAISRTTYAALFAVISTTFGVGDGSTTFNVPDLRGRTVFGQDDMGGSAASRLTGLSNGINGAGVGNTGGEEAHTLTQAQLPNVSLVSTSLSITNSYDRSVALNKNTTGATAGGVGVLDSTSTTLTKTTDTPAITGTVPLGGSGTAFNVIPPAIILNKCIYAGA